MGTQVAAGLVIALALTQGYLHGQSWLWPDPKRGPAPVEQSFGDLGNVDVSSGALTLRIPLAKLPPGRGGFSASLDARL